MMPPNLTEDYITEKLRIAWDKNGGKEIYNEADTSSAKNRTALQC